MPCTTLLVGKRASYDGSTIIARNEDSPNGEFTPKKLVVVKPEDQPRHYKSVLSHVEIELDEEPMRYTAVPNALLDEGIWAEAGVNTLNVAMSATETLTSNERVLAADPLVRLQKAVGTPGEEGYQPEVAGSIGEEDMVTLVLPYATSARDGVRRLAALLERYGTYEMNGIAFSDVDEIWWMETVGGHHWIARRVPDDCYVTMPNQLGIDAFDLADAEGEQRECMASADLRAWMARHHLDLTIREEGDSPDIFNPREAFGSASDADHVYNTPRAWAIQRFLNPRSNTWDGPDADFRPEDNDIPWCRMPERKITMEDVKYALSLHYQGTPFDPYSRRGTEVTRGMYRPIGINRNGQLAAMQLRPYASDETRALQWMAYGSNAFNALVPFFANVDEVPAYLENTTAQVTTESFYWANRLIAAMADAHFGDCVADIERYQMKVGAQAGVVINEATDGPADGLAAANQRIADMLRRETDAVLAKVLYTASMGMQNGFARSDG